MAHSFQRALGIAAALATSALITNSPAFAKDEKAAAKPGTEAPKIKLSKSAQKLAIEAQKANEAGDYATARAKLAEIDANPAKSKDEDWFVSQVMFDIAQRTNDTAGRSAALERMIGSPFLPADGPDNAINRRTIFRIQFDSAYRAKDYAKAFQSGLNYYDKFPSDDAMAQNTLVAGLQAKDLAGTEAFARKFIASKNGKVDEMYYKAIAETLQKSKSPKFGAALQELIRAYPTTENWKYALEDFQVRTRMIDRSGLDLFRLMMATGTATSNGEVLEAAQIAMDSGVPWETKAWINSGYASGKVTKDASSADLLRRAEAAIAAEEPLAKQEARSIPEKTGNQDVGIGQVYLSQGNYAKATDAFKRALSKSPRLKTETTIRLGIAQALAGDVAGAKATLASTTGDPKLVELAQLWSLYAEVKK